MCLVASSNQHDTISPRCFVSTLLVGVAGSPYTGFGLRRTTTYHICHVQSSYILFVEQPLSLIFAMRAVLISLLAVPLTQNVFQLVLPYVISKYQDNTCIQRASLGLFLVGSLVPLLLSRGIGHSRYGGTTKLLKFAQGFAITLLLGNMLLYWRTNPVVFLVSRGVCALSISACLVIADTIIQRMAPNNEKEESFFVKGFWIIYVLPLVALLVLVFLQMWEYVMRLAMVYVVASSYILFSQIYSTNLEHLAEDIDYPTLETFDPLSKPK